MNRFTYATSDLIVKSGEIEDTTPIGSQILRTVGYTPQDNVLLYQRLNEHGMEEISLEEGVNLKKGNHFFILKGDRSFKLKIDGFNYEWPKDTIGLKHLKAMVTAPDKQFFLTKTDTADLKITDDTVINLANSGIENIYTRTIQTTYELNVNGKTIVVEEPEIVVSKALGLAGITDGHNYQIILKIQGEPKKVVDLNTVIDLSKPGIEKLRLIPLEVNNGDSVQGNFEVLPNDRDYLSHAFKKFRTTIENGRRWLIVEDYQLPDGYNHNTVALAVEIPIGYPQAQLDMFYTYPAVQLLTGQQPDRTEHRETIEGKNYQRWSRHRGQTSMWNPAVDSIITHFALIEEAIVREVEA